MSQHTAYIYFAIRGDFNISHFESFIPLKADECTAKYSRIPERKLPRTNLLGYGKVSTNKELIDIYTLADEAVDILLPHQEKFATLLSDSAATAHLQVVLYFPTFEEIPTPIFGFSSKVITFLDKLGASIDIDTYRS
ncbi:DUF4279 domain-containing protein [Rubritalea tangerina]|uniref:DUF4279 domain-containing protein n=1 Tax=Rubritalea tangerina TaxID=430798 RepID=A0ABW4Z7Y2_9BACT